VPKGARVYEALRRIDKLGVTGSSRADLSVCTSNAARRELSRDARGLSSRDSLAVRDYLGVLVADATAQVAVVS
jgi:hypothetical protein